MPSVGSSIFSTDGQDLRGLSIEQRKGELARLLKGASFGLAINEHHEGDGSALFAEACRQGLEGIVSKRAGSRYRSGRSTDWVKAQNPASPAARRVAIEDWASSDEQRERSEGRPLRDQGGRHRPHAPRCARAIEAARNLQVSTRGAKTVITDLRDGSKVPLTGLETSQSAGRCLYGGDPPMNHDAIAHCERLIQRAKLELAKREGSSYR